MSSESSSVTPIASLVIVDDEKNMTKILSRILELEGYAVRAFNDPKEAFRAIQQETPDLLLSDIRMPGMTGIQLMEKAKDHDPRIPVIFLTAYGSIEGAVDSLRLGAEDYVAKPFQTDDLLFKIGKALERRSLMDENTALSAHLSKDSTPLDFIGESECIRRVRKMISKIGPTDSAVLITGSSGTGKELVARAIHRVSPRPKKRFVAINCASIPEQLLESELFGHEKGAFTGAHQRKMGLVELASGGTLFLDEIGEMPLHLQPKLLRMLQEKEIQRVGGTKPISVDIRLVAATNRDLEQAIQEGIFRQDLFYRINVVNIEIDSLYERPDDIPVLVDHFLNKVGRRLKRESIRLEPEALKLLEQYDWPGNVRELENLLEQTIVLLEGETIRPQDLPAAIRGAASADSRAESEMKDKTYREVMNGLERDYLTSLLDSCGGNVTEAARQANISRRSFYEKMEKMGLRAKEFK